MTVEATIKRLIVERGLHQKWVVDRMNAFNPNLNMSRSKFSAVVCGIRKLSGDEFIAFCQATGIAPDIFLSLSSSADGKKGA